MEDKESILKKIISFIKKLFKKEEPKLIPEKIEVTDLQDKRNKFLESLKINKEEPSELIELQKKYENNNIDLQSMSDQQIHELNCLYKRQINDLNKKIYNKKTEISMLQYSINGYLKNNS